MEVKNSDKLVAALRQGIAGFQPRLVIESGTYLGQGSTQAILSAFGENPPAVFYTLEVSRRFHEQARRNLAAHAFIQCFWGLSVHRQKAIEFLEQDRFIKDLDPNLDIYVDFLPDPTAGYLNEVRGGLGDESDQDAPQGLLGMLLENHRADRPLICLDSAGGLGWLEFQEMLRFQQEHPFLLFLDDINHVKHYRSKVYVESSAAFRVIDSDPEDGWMVAVYRAD
jgi:tRNA(1-methyladenosine) methyltransferase and related methyltransferases